MTRREFITLLGGACGVADYGVGATGDDVGDWVHRLHIA